MEFMHEILLFLSDKRTHTRTHTRTHSLYYRDVTVLIFELCILLLKSRNLPFPSTRSSLDGGLGSRTDLSRNSDGSISPRQGRNQHVRNKDAVAHDSLITSAVLSFLLLPT